jgi:DNA-binding CsgD family transcriptional regulator
MKSGVDKNQEQRLTEISRKLRHFTILTEDQWEQFVSLFEEIYPGFIDRTKDNEAEFTPAEVRYLALVKISRSNREMARMLGISEGAVRTIRYRLKRKLGFRSEVELRKIISAI